MIRDGTYTLLHVHSDYSLLDSCTDFKDYVDKVKEWGGTAIASTEHGMPRGWVGKKLYCDANGIKFIHGVEIYLTRELEPKVRDNYHTILLAKNFEGVLELNKLVTRSSQDDHFYYVNRISFEEFVGISDNIITTSACLASPLNKLDEDDEWYERLVNRYDFLEVQPHLCDDQVKFNKRLARLSAKYGKPLVVGTDTHSGSDYKAECRDILLKAKKKSYGDEDAFDLTLRSYGEIVKKFEEQGVLTEAEYLSALDNTNKIAEMCEDFDLDKAIKYPILYGSQEEDEKQFIERTWEGLESKLEAGIIPSEQEEGFRNALQEELRVFKKLKMCGFMLSMSELIRWCKSNGLAIGTARGSVGGSRAAYVTDIIDLNPETWKTNFARFCNPSRTEIGDIDIDCIITDRPKIFKFITGKFGADKTARVAAYGTLADKSVISEVCRALEISLIDTKKIKEEFAADPDETRKKYPNVFYYYDGLAGTKISQSIHPAGMVISPITLDDNYGTFQKDGETCLLMDMEEAHEVGLAKYDFLALTTVEIIRDTCEYIGIPYPRTNEFNWDDLEVWRDMRTDLTEIFQFESVFAANSFKKFKPENIFDMSLVTACIRPTGASYRDELLDRKVHHNPAPMIDELFKNEYGYLVYQEQTIAFLQQICGLSGSEADNVRRAIGRKQIDRLNAALPSILEGYCSKSEKPREEAEVEAKEFLKVIEDSASYQFNYSHSVAYCLLGYMCGYFRYYYPYEFLTAVLNANSDDQERTANIVNYAQTRGIQVTMPKWGVSRERYAFDKEKKIISKDLTSIKFISNGLAKEMYVLANERKFNSFVELLSALCTETSINTRQLDILIKLDFFSEFGNQSELLEITNMFYELFDKGNAKKIAKEKVADSPYKNAIEKYSVGVTKAGGEAKAYTMLDNWSAMIDCEKAIRELKLPDASDLVKVRNFEEAMGYIGYISGKEEDRRKLYVLDMHPIVRRKDGKKFGYSIKTKSIGSGKEAWFTVFDRVFDKCPFEKNDVIWCSDYKADGKYFTLTSYKKVG